VPRRYPVEFRRKVLDLIESGEPVVEIAVQLGITAQSLGMLSPIEYELRYAATAARDQAS